MKKKVLHIINSLTTGGAEVLLANSLSPGGLNEHLDNYLLYFNQTSHLEKLIDKDVKTICLNYKGGLDIFRLLRDIKKTIVENNIDIVHTHLTPAGIYTHMACPPTVPHVHTIHTTYSMDNETNWFKRWMDKTFFLQKKNCNVISLSNYTKDDFLKSVFFKGKIFVLNNFVADRYFDLPEKNYSQQSNMLRLVAVGSLKPLKNFEYLLEVFEHLKDKEIYLDIYGEGGKTKYEKVIEEKNLKVKMMGRVDDMSTVIQRYDLFIMPSKFEGFPLSVFEAMAAGVPVMLSAIAPLQSIAKDNAVYFSLDDAAKTAEQISAVYQNNNPAGNLAIKARAYATQTAKRDTYIKNLLEIYSQLV